VPFDTHVHLEHPALGAPRLTWERARAAGVDRLLAVGVGPATWSETVAAADVIGVDVALGIHPELVPELDDATLDAALAALPARLVDARAIAVGECGLDGPSGDLDRQIAVLRAHLRIARELSLPVCLHVFRVQERALAVVREAGPLPAGGVVHSYSGSAELVRNWARLGFSFAFGGALTRSNARRPQLAARAVPDELLLAETDAPFQPAGEDARDRAHGEPADLPLVLAAIAAARGVDPATIVALTDANAQRLFGPRRDPIRGRTGSGGPP